MNHYATSVNSVVSMVVESDVGVAVASAAVEMNNK